MATFTVEENATVAYIADELSLPPDELTRLGGSFMVFVWYLLGSPPPP